MIKSLQQMTAEELRVYDLAKIGGEFIVGRRLVNHAFVPRAKFYTLAEAVEYCIRAEGGLAEHQIFEPRFSHTPNFCDQDSIRLGYNPSSSHGWAGFEDSGVIFWKGEDFLRSYSLPLEARIRVEKVFTFTADAVSELRELSYSANQVFGNVTIYGFRDLEQMVALAENSWDHGDAATFDEGRFWYGTPSIEILIEQLELSVRVTLSYNESVGSHLGRSSTMKSGSMFKAAIEQGWGLRVPVGLNFYSPEEWRIKEAHPEQYLNETAPTTTPRPQHRVRR